MGCRTAVRRKAESAARLASMPTALELLDLVFDAGTWSSWDTPAADPPGIDPEYARALAAARARTGLDESVLTGEGRIGGRRVAAVACEFGFLGGSVGAVAAARLAAALARATAEGLPVLASPAPGWSRCPRRSAGTSPPGCPTWCTCGIPPPAGCSRPGARSGSSASPSLAR